MYTNIWLPKGMGGGGGMRDPSSMMGGGGGAMGIAGASGASVASAGTVGVSWTTDPVVCGAPSATTFSVSICSSNSSIRSCCS